MSYHVMSSPIMSHHVKSLTMTYLETQYVITSPPTAPSPTHKKDHNQGTEPPAPHAKACPNLAGAPHPKILASNGK